MHSYVSDGFARIYPVRDLRNLPTVFSNIGGLMLTAIVKITQHYRPEELETIRLSRLKPWAQALLDMARTKINVESISTAL